MHVMTLLAIGIVLTVVGIVLTVIGMLLLSAKQSEEKEKVRGGGVVLIGPFPIVFGTDRQSLKIVIILAIVLTTLALIAVIAFYFISR